MTKNAGKRKKRFKTKPKRRPDRTKLNKNRRSYMTITDFFFDTVYDFVTWVLIALSAGFLIAYFFKGNWRGVMWACIALACCSLIMGAIRADKHFFRSGKTAKPLAEMRPPIRGLLIPTNDPSPTTKCPTPPANYKAIYFGNAVASINPAGNAFSLIKIANEDVLSFESTSGGIVINAILRDEKGKVIATIKKNVFRVEPNTDYEATSPDKHSLLVLDKQDQAVLYVRYLNPNAIKILGIFHHPQRRQPLKIEEDGVTFGAGKPIRGLCIGEVGIWPGQVGITYP